MKQLGEVVSLMKCSQESMDSRRDLTVIENFRRALELLDDYDHQTMKQLNGISSAYTLTYEECRQVIDQVIIRKGSISAVNTGRIASYKAFKAKFEVSPKHYRLYRQELELREERPLQEEANK